MLFNLFYCIVIISIAVLLLCDHSCIACLNVFPVETSKSLLIDMSMAFAVILKDCVFTFIVSALTGLESQESLVFTEIL